MNICLSFNEARVLGVLIEKAATTPDQYPLSLHAVTTGCNQKSNRDPVTNLDQTAVVEALDGLVGKRLIRERSDAGSRVAKYAHRLSGSLGLTFDFGDDELALLCVLMLRGPQTVGELRIRTARLWAFQGLDEVEQLLERLAEHADGPYVRRLAREPGRKEARYVHLLCGAEGLADDAQQPAPTGATEMHAAAAESDGAVTLAPDTTGAERLARLEDEVANLKRELADLKEQLGV